MNEMKLKLNQFKRLKNDLEDLKEYQCGDHPTRIIYIGNVMKEQIEGIQQEVAKYAIKSIYANDVETFNYIMIFFYDLREAKNAFKHLKETYSVSYALAKDVLNYVEQNQGSLVVFNLGMGTTNEEIKELFGNFGDVKEVRATPGKQHHKFVEYFDIRDAQKAWEQLNQTEWKGKKLKVEPSRPGGIRQRLLKQCVEALGLGDGGTVEMGAFPNPIEMTKLIVKEMKSLSKGTEMKLIQTNTCCGKKQPNPNQYAFGTYQKQTIKPFDRRIKPTQMKPLTRSPQFIQPMIRSNEVMEKHHVMNETKQSQMKEKETEISLTVPRPTSIGQELSKEYEKHSVGTPHLIEKKFNLFQQIEMKGIGLDQKEDVEEMKRVLVIENIPNSFTHQELIEKIEDCVSCFYDQLFFLQSNEKTYKCVIRVTNQVVVENFKRTFDKIFLENDQETLCTVHETHCQGATFTDHLSSLLL